MSLTRDGKLKLLFAYLAVSAASVRAIPFLLPWGADLQNLHAYQLCAHSRNPYFMAGDICGDPYKRDLVYPPLLFHSFAWVRKLTVEKSMYVWTGAMLLTMAVVHAAWARLGDRDARRGGRWEVVVFCSLLTLQAPFIFLLERGGTDGVPLLLWTGATYLVCKKRFALAGAVAGVAAAYKVYPAIPCAVVTWGLAVGAWRRTASRRTDFLLFGAAAAVTFVAINLMFWSEAHAYFTVALPKFAKLLTEKNVWSHALPSFAGADHDLYARLPMLMLFALWCWSVGRGLAERPVLALAGALAMSTYFAATSWDYNLVTTFPLLLAQFLEARRTDRWGTLVLGLVAIVGDRAFFTTETLGLLNPSTHLGLELAWLIVSAIEIARPGESTPAAAPATVA